MALKWMPHCTLETRYKYLHDDCIVCYALTQTFFLEVVSNELGHLPVVGAPMIFKLLGGLMTARVGGGVICCRYLVPNTLSALIVAVDGIVIMHNLSIGLQ
jgi:hypothetical protein